MTKIFIYSYLLLTTLLNFELLPKSQFSELYNQPMLYQNWKMFSPNVPEHTYSVTYRCSMNDALIQNLELNRTGRVELFLYEMISVIQVKARKNDTNSLAYKEAELKLSNYIKKICNEETENITYEIIAKKL